MELTRKHYTLLREYWHCRRGLCSRGDGLALDLTAAGMLEKDHNYDDMLVLRITREGILALQQNMERERACRQPHHDLGNRLAAWLQQAERLTWCNIEFRVEIDGLKRLVRPDVFSLAITLNQGKINPVVHEVKVSRADFLADLAKPEKRGGYSRIAEQMYYAAPAGMISRSEVPDGIGLVEERGEGEFEVLVKAKRKPVELTAQHFMNLIIKHQSIGIKDR